MQNLPINDVLAEIQNTLNTHNRVVLQAPPGAGKTTAVPIALLDQPWLHDKQIIMLEPRRIAARNAASRMAFLLNEKVGQTVGYQIRQDTCFTEKTKILVVTEGILTRKLQADPELKKTALVIFDEFHERSLHADLSLALCLQSQQILRDDLKVLVMSATLNSQAISRLLGDVLSNSSLNSSLNKAPIIQSEGRSYPVTVRYLDKPVKQNDHLQLISNLVSTVKHVITEQQGDCLVFLPGVKEINQLAGQIKQYLKTETINNVLITPLHGSLNKQQQDQAIVSAPGGMRKIVLATNIAETSLTIEGISCVIDSGLERILEYNPSSGMNSLKTQFISQDSAEQRSGRAGRLSAGVSYRLWTAQQQQRLIKHSLAEILHSDLSTLVLELSNWGVQQADELQWLDMPPTSATEQAKSLLQQLGAIDSNGKINQHGRDMLRLGTHPRLAHMILAAAKLGQAYHACLIAGILTEKDLFLANAEKTVDIHDRLSALQQIRQQQTRQRHTKQIQTRQLRTRQLQTSSPRTQSYKNEHNIDLQQCRRIIQTADDFYKRVKRSTQGSINNNHEKGVVDDLSIDDLSGVLLAYAYPDRIAKQRSKNSPRYLLSNGKGATIPTHLQHSLHEFLVVANLDAKHSEASIYLAAEITAQQLQDYFIDNIQQLESIEWNETQQRVEAKQTSRIGKIILQETRIGDANAHAHDDSRAKAEENKQAVQQCLLQAIKDTGLSCLNWSEQADNLKQRVQFINHQLNNGQALKQEFIETRLIETQLIETPLPDFSEETLLNTLSEWLQPHLTNENSIKQCQKLDLHKLLSSQLSWQQQQLINKLAPEKITVPSGSAISIDYSDPVQAVLAVRLQEVFGLYDTPTLLNGHCKVMMHLLSPARRPMQVTQDLNSFWQTTYHDVKKELRGKYKRHYWPDDPLTAQATSKTKKQMNR